MTELPRYIGRHASPEAAAPSAGEPPPEFAASEADLAPENAVYEADIAPAAEPAMPRLEFDPSDGDEPTTIIDPARQIAEADFPEEPATAGGTSPPEWWRAERGRAESPAPGPGPYRSGPPGIPGPPKPPGPPRPPSPPGPPSGSTDDPAAAPDTWTAPAPDIASGPAPEPEARSEPEPESEPETEAATDVDSDPAPDSESDSDSEPVPENESASDGEAESWAEEADEPEAPADEETDPGPEPIPEPEAEPDMPLRSESDWSATPVFPSSGPSPVRSVSAVSDIDSHGLARIALLDVVKEIWPGGTPDLSAWLAAHLELLEDPLGFSLTPRHHAPGQVVDDFDADQSPLDIPGNLLTADLGGAAVMVRAQAEDADTEGLGALLGAAAVAQAQTAVWVCPRIDPGLRQALRWVGGDPSANVRLYGLEMYLVQIAGSPTAPLFDAVVSPGAP